MDERVYSDLGRIGGIFTSLPLYPSSEIVKKSAAKKKILIRGGRHVDTKVDGVVFYRKRKTVAFTTALTIIVSTFVLQEYDFGCC